MNRETIRWVVLLLCCNLFWIVAFFGLGKNERTPTTSIVTTDSWQSGNTYQSQFSRGRVSDPAERHLLLKYKLDPDNLDEAGAKVIAFQKQINEYTEEHKKVMEERRSRTDQGRKYLLCQPINGMGNMMQAAIACILYAMVAERTVVIDNVNNHFIPPEHWPFVAPEGSTDIVFHREDFDDICEKNKTDKCYGIFEVRPDTENLMCVNLKEHLGNKKVIQVYGSWYYDYFGPYLTVNPHHKLYSTLPRNWYQMLWDHFFDLKPEIRTRVDEFKKKNFGKWNVALQIRTPVSTPGAGPGGNDHWYAPELPAKELFFQAAESMSRSAPASYDKITWFIAAQNQEIVDWFVKNREGRVAWFEHKPTVAYDMQDIEGKIAAVITFYLMSECDDIVVTDFSSYGHCAAGKGGLVPVACNQKGFCTRRLTAEPW
eukprot:TRINITY_DN1776_c0_g1_i3.p1 TRINITY_DN1776_c0_g1~~TRINITY_DN1776_c0_g1_i3.p1  ORF type:complete len:428 (-),score=91.35 TRINITY_DN1776_c0_g1_i3:926-2209(-)